MYGCQQELIKSPENLSFLEYLCTTANNLINCSIYLARQWYFKLGYITGKYNLEKQLKSNINYKFLHSQAAQQTLRGVAEAFKSYKELSNKYNKGELADRPQLPKYRKKGGMGVITYPKQALKLEKGKVRVPLGKKVKALFKIDAFFLNFPSNLEFKEIKEIRILPRNGCFYVEWVYELKADKPQLDKGKVLGIDHGVDNWLSCVSNVSTSFIIDGKHLKSKNQWYNKQVANIKEGQPQGFWSKKLARITEKRNRQMRDAVNKAARLVINHCLEYGIGRIVFGWNKGQKNNIDIGTKNNQKFVQIPTAKLKERINQLCGLYGIELIETEESYTSQASFLDDDFLPTIGEKPKSWNASGKRIKRGLYQTLYGLLINADINGAANILKKVATTLGFSLEGVGRGTLTMPLRVRFWTA
ncbi:MULTISPECIES: transposase [unclassified Okeania]|uniref:RNA-guided endonuclease InsQ/TnpB family protein n=1 Tax=unclassified Okeania TaxID=2634635 RepID=UPI0013BB4419|nr:MULTISPECIES: transposase [unclassified Okeania]NES77592.1 IS200/IS605 family element transposase accessory protein TnpB [Okeania sp. SIO1H4]NET15046.1 IS200/IS605 family element transposase accessory protein TnpB [Okeania sp. SIO1H6]NET21218.1 IS200/IS605 family element transposase accessory protein TnpB [Okeania sp. SIO1H5]NET96330.1 IS200/IS605 family element transposase accessory protein TnpB [Okeania sp. SIO1H2]